MLLALDHATSRGLYFRADEGTQVTAHCVRRLPRVHGLRRAMHEKGEEAEAEQHTCRCKNFG